MGCSREKHILVYGKVQGVHFRLFTSKKAKEYQLKGWVRNLENGSVEILVKGDHLKIKDFVLEIKRGSKKARVTKVKVKNIEDLVLKSKNLDLDLNKKAGEEFLILNDSQKAVTE